MPGSFQQGIPGMLFGSHYGSLVHSFAVRMGTASSWTHAEACLDSQNQNMSQKWTLQCQNMQVKELLQQKRIAGTSAGSSPFIARHLHVSKPANGQGGWWSHSHQGKPAGLPMVGARLQQPVLSCGETYFCHSC